MRCLSHVLAFMLVSAAPVLAQGPPVTYRVTFPAAEHHWMQVEATFPALGTAPLAARMSRSSPGRYAVHEFAKNVFVVEAYDGTGRALTPTRPDADEWHVAGHDGTVRLVYRIFGDHADGTYMAVDTTHAHLNMPAAFMWARGLEMRPIEVSFVPPSGSHWKVGTQLFPTSDPFAFTAPNLQYFMDSPTELADFLVAAFDVPHADGTPAHFRLVVHAAASQADVDALAALVERLVREQVAVFGDLPRFETGQYTFLLDYVPWASGDGMEHRNSTSISGPGRSLGTARGRVQALSTISHEFFHVWNVERVRPAGLEPFDFTRQNITCCLWLAEGFTQYYGNLLLTRSGFSRLPPVNYAVAAINGPGRAVRSAVQMSEYAPFSDAGVANDVTDQNRTFVSYYSYGAAIALGLDLTLRERSDDRLSLDDYMQLLWETYGKPADPRPGFVARPYTLRDLRASLAQLSGDQAFADEFFDRHVEGRDVVDYARLLSSVGYVVRPAAPSRGWVGSVPVDDGAAGLVVGGTDPPVQVPFGTPLYDAGVEAGDVIVSIDQRLATRREWAAIGEKGPGDRIALVVQRRDGQRVTTTATVRVDPQIQVVSLEDAGGTLSGAARARRESWLGTKVR